VREINKISAALPERKRSMDRARWYKSPKSAIVVPVMGLRSGATEKKRCLEITDSEEKAEEVCTEILEMQREHFIDIGDAVIATCDAQGRIRLNQLLHTTATGTLSGRFRACWSVGFSSCRQLARPSAPAVARHRRGHGRCRRR